MGKKSIIGRCCICGENKKLTFEHIPPNKAFNSLNTKIITGDELTKLISDKNRLPWETKGLKYKQMQKGVGLYSLCSQCNNLTGSYYGDSYVYLANVFHFIISTHEMKTPGVVQVEIKNVYPLRFLKQVISMFCSTYDGFTKTFPKIKTFLLDKNNKELDRCRLKITMYLIENYTIQYSGFNCICYSDWSTRTLASLDTYPFGFTLEIDPKDKFNGELDITNFIDYDYNECVNLKFSIPIYQKNTVFPEDHRNKKDFIKNTFSPEESIDTN